MTSTASPGADRSRGESACAAAASGTCAISTWPLKRLRQRRHLLADQDRIIDAGRLERLGQRGVEVVAVGAELAHRAEHGDAPPGDRLLAEHRRASRAIEAGLAL